jgi:serine/threonine protein kinase
MDPELPTQTVLSPGTQVGPYRIEAPFGVGGMGEVFRGVDTRLGRPVAIKFAHRQFSERFEREAKAISALNHSHICTLYDVGVTQSGSSYLVMELVEGDTLAARLRKGPLSMEQVLRHGAEIAGAIAAAHEKGITHRDLKPGNIMLARSGVKVLDFGLARSILARNSYSVLGRHGNRQHRGIAGFPVNCVAFSKEVRRRIGVVEVQQEPSGGNPRKTRNKNARRAAVE